MVSWDLARSVAAWLTLPSLLACERIVGVKERPFACRTHADCAAALSDPAVCRSSDQSCQRVFSEDCTKLLGDPKHLANARTVVLGTLLSTGTERGLARERAVELAATDFQDSTSGIQDMEGGPPRPLVFVACSDSVASQRAAQHLVVDLEIPAIIGAGTSDATIRVRDTVATPHGTLLVAPSATAVTVTAENNPLVWRTAPPDFFQAELLRHQAHALQQANGPHRLAMIYKKGAYGDGLGSAVSVGLLVNGNPAKDDPTTFYRSLYDAEKPEDLPAIVTEVLSRKPTIIMLIGTGELVAGLLEPVEARWTGPEPRPKYLLSDGIMQGELLLSLASNEDLRPRVRGTVPGAPDLPSKPKSDAAKEFEFRYESLYKAQPTFGVPQAYDAAYLLAYAAYQSSGQPRGVDLARAFANLTQGPVVSVGPRSIPTAFSALSRGSMDLDGASGPLGFDLVKHEAPSDFDLLCVRRVDAETVRFQSSGLYYDAVKGIAGAYGCP